jgi:hypothetical protein
MIPTALARLAAGVLGEAALAGEESTLLTMLASRLGGLYDKDAQEITIPVSSSAISEIGFREPGIITVVFKRGGSLSYDFPGSETEFAAFALSPSKGRFFNAHFRDR